MRVILLIFIFSMSVFAGPYIAGSISQYEQQDASEGDANADFLLSGNGVGLYLGYKRSFFAIEGIYKTYSAKGSDGDLSFNYNNTAKGLGARIYILSFINFKFGTIIHDAKGTLKNGETITLEYESTQSTPYTGLGITFNFKKLDVFVDVNYNAQEDDIVDNASIYFQEMELGARYYF